MRLKSSSEMGRARSTSSMRAPNAPPPGLIFAVNMLVNTERGDTFSFGEIARWLTAAGFTDARLVEELPCPSPLILATKPG